MSGLQVKKLKDNTKVSNEEECKASSARAGSGLPAWGSGVGRQKDCS